MHWVTKSLDVIAKKLIYIDETLFNKNTDWRHKTYAFVERFDRYHANRTKNYSWSVLSAYTINDFLLCTNIKENWYNAKKFYNWIVNQLMFQCSVWSIHRNVIVINNVFIHTNSRIQKIIEAYDCKVCYLFLYSLDFNFIELTFSILKI